jgi:hypothetical protein
VKNLLTIYLSGLCFVLSAQVSPPKRTFFFQQNASLKIIPADTAVVDVEIIQGDKLVFFYEWQSARNPQIADAESTHKLYFELSPKTKKLQLSNENLKQVNTIRCRLCFCVEGGCRIPKNGELTVSRIRRNAYKVTFKDTPDEEHFFINEVFLTKKTEK